MYLLFGQPIQSEIIIPLNQKLLLSFTADPSAVRPLCNLGQVNLPFTVDLNMYQ